LFEKCRSLFLLVPGFKSLALFMTGQGAAIARLKPNVTTVAPLAPHLHLLEASPFHVPIHEQDISACGKIFTHVIGIISTRQLGWIRGNDVAPLLRIWIRRGAGLRS
jgi:hypothetical protein